MKTDDKLKTRAIQLRKEGKTYREILMVVPVAKSTLSSYQSLGANPTPSGGPFKMVE